MFKFHKISFINKKGIKDLKSTTSHQNWGDWRDDVIGEVISHVKATRRFPDLA